MKSFSMWEIEGVTNLEEAIVLLQENRTIHVPVAWGDSPLLSEVKNIDNFDFEFPESIEINNQHVRYIFFEGTTERAKKEEYWYDANNNFRDRNDRVNPYQVNMLIFELNNSLKLIAFSGKTRANIVITDIFRSDAWGSIRTADHRITDDLLYWIFKRYIDIPNESLSENRSMYVTALRSYTGKTRDNAHAIRGDGQRISTILGTLAFLFNNENLKAVRPQLQYEGEIILLEIGLSGTFKYSETEYQGRFLGGLTGDRLHNSIAIYIYTTIIPNLVECYRENLIRGDWSPRFKADFLKRLGEEIKRRVEVELTRIENDNVDENGETDDMEEFEEIDDLNAVEDSI